MSFILPVILIAVLLVGAVYLLKILMPKNDADDTVRIKDVGSTSAVVVQMHEPSSTQTQAPPEQAYYDQPPTERLRRKPGFPFMPMLILAVIGYLAYSNQDLIAEKIPDKIKKFAREKTSEKTKKVISLAEVEGHAVVDGVNWIKIVATSSTGISFEGWVSELAIRKEPPKENPTSDAFMKKLGLQTNKERLEGVKHMRKIGDALDTALKDFRPKKE